MDNDIYEVSRDDYVGFLQQIKKECRDVQIYGRGEDCTEIKTYSKDNKRHFATRIIQDGCPERYFIIDMPLPSERSKPKAIKKITLETQEEVQTFFNILSKVIKENNNGRDIC